MSVKSRRQAIAQRRYSQAIDFDAQAVDEAAEICSEWLTRHAEHKQLIRRWQRLETRLIQEHNLFKLNKRDRASLSEACELDAINARLIVLHEQNQKALLALPAVAATTTEGIVSKLSVALANIDRYESKATHQLIQSVLRDLEMVMQVLGK
jgi:hypothetical protein